jgi:hypothetical protein
MEVDLVVALEPWPIKSKVISTIGILSNIVDGYSEVEGVAFILATTPAWAKHILVEQSIQRFSTQQPKMIEQIQW